MSDLKTAINAVSNVTGVTASATAAVYGTTTFGSAGSNNGLTFTDIRNVTTNPDDATTNTQTLKVAVAAATASQTLSVSSASTANSLTLTITLGHRRLRKRDLERERREGPDRCEHEQQRLRVGHSQR